jgi:integrase
MYVLSSEQIALRNWLSLATTKLRQNLKGQLYMASISKEPNGRKTIQFVGKDDKRRSIRLGKMSIHKAETIKSHVEELLAASLSRQAIDRNTANWLAEIPDALHDKLSTAGLVAKRTPVESGPGIGEFLDEYLRKRVDVKPATKEIWGHTVRNLKDFFGTKRDLTSITEGDAEDFKMYLINQKLAPTTIHKRLQFARKFFKDATKRKIIGSNPLAEVGSPATMSKDRQRFITVEEIEKVLTICDITWQTIIALCRYGGLRCPSEVLSLRWEDVDWERQRIMVQSPKTEHHPGKECREIPLFLELRPYLEKARAAAGKDTVYVVDENLRKRAIGKNGWRNANLRTQFKRLIERAGLKPWPRLFHNLRASRETELAKSYPLKAVTEWFGNTMTVAVKHYLQATDSDFEKAASQGARCVEPAATPRAAESGADILRRLVQLAVQQPSADFSNVSHETTQAPVVAGACADTRWWLREVAKILNGEDGIRTHGGL